MADSKKATKKKAPKKEVKKNGVDARVTRLEALMRRVVQRNEIHFGKDIDGDGKIGFIRVWVLALISVVALGTLIGYAAQNAETGDIWGDVDGGVVRIRSNGDYDTDGGVVAAGNLGGATITASGTLAVTGESTLTGGIAALKDGSLASAVSATNGAPVAMAGLVVRLSAVDGTNNATNTVTLDNLADGEAGNLFLLVNVGTSNHVAIASSGTWKSDALELAENDSVWVVAITSNSFYSAGQ